MNKVTYLYTNEKESDDSWLGLAFRIVYPIFDKKKNFWSLFESTLPRYVIVNGWVYE